MARAGPSIVTVEAGTTSSTVRTPAAHQRSLRSGFRATISSATRTDGRSFTSTHGSWWRWASTKAPVRRSSWKRSTIPTAWPSSVIRLTASRATGESTETALATTGCHVGFSR